MSKMQPIENHVEQAQERYVDILRDKERLAQLTAIVVSQIQEVEDVLFELLYERALNDLGTGEEAIGAQLDGIGRIIGLTRFSGQSDDSYRLDLNAWVQFLRSQGEAETIIFVLKALTDSTDVQLVEYFPAHIVVFFDGVVLNGTNLAAIMDKCAAAGVRIDCVPVSDETFRFDSGPGFDVGLWTSVLG